MNEATMLWLLVMEHGKAVPLLLYCTELTVPLPVPVVLFTVEVATLTRVREEGSDKDKTVIRVLPADELNDLIKIYNEKEEARKREERAKEERAKEKAATATAS